MIIYGIHPVINFLKAKPKLVKRIFLSKKFDNEILKRFKVEYIGSNEIGKITKTTDHQGIACEITNFPFVSTDNLIEKASRVLILDHIEDPRNLGAILRNAFAFDIELVIIPKDRACDITPTVIKASAGNAVYLKISKVTNINNFIRNLKDHFYKVYGFESCGNKLLSEISFSGKIAIVLGSEGKGIRELTKNLCDEIVSIDFNSEAGSLNVSSASAIVLYKIYMNYLNFA